LNQDILKALFLLSGFDLGSIFQIKNEYGPDECYGPWWLVQTKYGLIKIGWRKRVINIEWDDTPYRAGESKFWDDRPIDNEYGDYKFTKNNVTQGPTHVHAWGYAKAVEYLQHLRLQLQRTVVRKEQYKHMWDADDKG
jgi:hypothetical protein